MDRIERNYYLNQLIEKRDYGRVKVIIGIRRCGKSLLLFDIHTQKTNFDIPCWKWLLGIDHVCKESPNDTTIPRQSKATAGLRAQLLLFYLQALKSVILLRKLPVS